jgi:chromosome segregation protein
MLKALELSGFKSFADRTRFEFPSGVSVVVGPNGSGKSNVVDAVKWVLGSQSAKSLRGKEMTDVIFNGCPTRGPLGTGEATLTLDNSDGRLAIDAREVQITRRVYRSGEGEYLLNRQPCRLRDIRDLLAGTGITTEAYCIIEQGKVDALLQASPRDRRVIFEEAAGISQFKAKKATAARRMERVEQNLLRLSDIVDEVESRLRSVRAQAGKARRYREWTKRLEELRTAVGLVDWRRLTKQIDAKEAQLAELRERLEQRGALLERAELQIQALERDAEAHSQNRRELEAAASAVREQIAASQASVDSQQARRGDLQQEAARIRQQFATISTRGDDHSEQSRNTAALLRTAETQLAAAEDQKHARLDDAQKSQCLLTELERACEQTRTKLLDTSRAMATLDEEAKSLRSQALATSTTLEAQRRQLDELESHRAALAAQLCQHEQHESQWAAQAQAHEAALGTAEQRLAHVRRELLRADKQQRQLEGQFTRTRERIAVLSELEHRLEGIAGSVHQALQAVQETPDRQFGEVYGLVADLFHVDVDSAPLIEMALGERAQFIVVESAPPLLESLKNDPLNIAERVGFLSLHSRTSLTALDHVDLTDEAGVMGRADRFVEAAAQFEPLVRRLLGRTWLVNRLNTALRLWQSSGRGLDFVTSDGEVLTADGTLIVGPRKATTGVLSCRSQLRACREQSGALEQQLAHQTEIHRRMDEERARQEDQLAASVAAYTAAAQKLANRREETAVCRVQLARLDHDLQLTQQELRKAEERLCIIETDAQANRTQYTECSRAAHELEVQLRTGEQDLQALKERQTQADAAVIAAQISAAKCEERVEMLRRQLDQATQNEQQRARARAESLDQLADRESQIAALDTDLLAQRQALAELFIRKEEQAGELARLAVSGEEARRQRAELAEQVRLERRQLTALQGQQQKLEVAATRLRHERETLCERMQEDYGIDLAEAAGSVEPGARNTDRTPHDHTASDAEESAMLPADRGEVEREIAELRNQINNIGAINVDALDELEQLESRFETLSTQYRDLVDAKNLLERTIQRINVDSRQLFLATVEMVRGHFQELFRRLFGGGEADIIIDEADDVLESGIEVVARPPGKEACSISLLSGGEKTLTCVALLLAVFRSKPSPFCILDEVDAALDEANIGRFINVLREFLSFTQFVVVTHSKKTMAGADTLYGVTMEESGVSKRVSVRFEDVSEDGTILPHALSRAA